MGDVIATLALLFEELLAVDPPFLPVAVLRRRQLSYDCVLVVQVLVQWHCFGEEERTWVDVPDMLGQFPEFSLEDKAVSSGGPVDRAPLIVYKRRPKKAAERSSSCLFPYSLLSTHLFPSYQY
ncbi:hypothetical protein OROHE_014503 [Orobanche hederae]